MKRVNNTIVVKGNAMKDVIDTTTVLKVAKLSSVVDDLQTTEAPPTEGLSASVLPTAKNDLNVLDAASLEFLTNPLYHKVKAAPKLAGFTESELHFYRKRILAFTKSMVKQTETPCRTLQIAFDAYVFSLIGYFKMQDKQEIVQKKFLEEVEGNEVEGHEVEGNEAQNDHMAQNANEAQNDMAFGEPWSGDSGEDDNLEEFDMVSLDTSLMTKPSLAPNLDNYVIKTNVDPTQHVMPIKLDIEAQLQLPQYKTKGVPKKTKPKNKKLECETTCIGKA